MARLGVCCMADAVSCTAGFTVAPCKVEDEGEVVGGEALGGDPALQLLL